MIKILVIDDENSICEFFDIFLKKLGFEAITCNDGLKALEIITRENINLVISDIKMPNISGIQILEKIKETDPSILVILITAFATTESAIEAMKKGAYDYIIKPFEIDEITLTIKKAIDLIKLEEENRLLKSVIKKSYNYENIIGKSRKMQAVFSTIEKIKCANINILITGESGTGKEIVAKAIHYNSGINNKPFVALNCAAIPENLLESELFGHIKGSFTGAIQNKKGLFESADGGTIFLDEIGELPLNIQVKLLRVLQEKVIRRLGSLNDIKVDFRIISATNKDLWDAIKNKLFREDLFYRLNVLHINIPPLRERREDIPFLIKHFIDKYSKKFEKTISGISNEALENLMNYDYPGNIRELENFIESSIAISSEKIIDLNTLPNELKNNKILTKKDFQLKDTGSGINLEKEMDKIEKAFIFEALKLSEGNKQKAAKLLNISERSLRYKIEKLNIL